jgi:arginine/lysine/ornithine decarboxylase
MNPQHAMHRELSALRNAELLREAQIDERSGQRTEVALQAVQASAPALGFVASWVARRRLVRRPAFHGTT